MSKNIARLGSLAAAFLLGSLALVCSRSRTSPFYVEDRLVDGSKLMIVPSGKVSSITLTADASGYLISGENEIVLVRTKDDFIISRFAGVQPFGDAAISASMKVLAVRSREAGIYVFDVLSAKQVTTLDEPGGRGFGIALSPNGAFLASCVASGGLTIWDTRMGRRLTASSELRQPEMVSFSPDGKLLAVGGDGGTILILDTTGFRTIARLKMAGYASINALDFSPDGAMLFAGGGHVWTKGGEGGESSGIVNVWSVSDWSERYGRKSAGNIAAVGLGSDGKHLVICRDHGGIEVHALESGVMLWQMTGEFAQTSCKSFEFSVSQDVGVLLEYGETRLGGKGSALFKVWRWCPRSVSKLSP